MTLAANEFSPPSAGFNPIKAGKRGFMRFWYGYVGALNRLLPSITLHGKTLAISLRR